MIFVEIIVPSVDNTYDFQLDEDSTINNIIGEVAELIAQKERCIIKGKSDSLMLCSLKDKSILPLENTLRECGVQTGDCLELV